jgi:hypothetical protein
MMEGTTVTECSKAGCVKPAYAKRTGLCRPHNTLLTHHGSTDATEVARRRFNERVLTVESGCWEWQGSRGGSKGEYGAFSMTALGRPTTQAHRAAWTLLRGPIPEGFSIDHLCRNTICVNPDHLEPVEPGENTRRRFYGLTHCGRGHELTPDNTYRWAGDGRRKCRACHRDKERARRARQKGDRDAA